MADLAFGHEHGNAVVLARRDRKVGDAFDTQLVPDLGQIVALIDLDLVRHDSSAEFLVEGILEIPAGLRLLHESANGLLF